MPRPVEIERKDKIEDLITKLQIIVDDIYKKFDSLNANIYDFVSEDVIPQQVIVSIDSDQSDTDISSHESTYNHDNLHSRSHGLSGSSDHTSTITENNLMDADANGLPDDSGLSVANVSDAVTKRHAQNTDTDLDATFEASLKNADNHTSGSTNYVLARQAAEADLDQTITDPPTQAEVQAISDKVDAILAKLRSANVIAS